MICYFSEKLTFLNRYSYANNYRAHFFDKILRKFTLSSHHTQEKENSNEGETCFFKVLHMGPASKQFTKSLSELVYHKFGSKLMVVYDTFKINRYFQLKTKTLHALCSNVVYQFQCSCDANLAYLCMTT